MTIYAIYSLPMGGPNLTHAINTKTLLWRAFVLYVWGSITFVVLGLIFPHVAGPSFPLQPSNLMSTDITHNRATIQWTVSMIAYSPETYTVYFGTSPGLLTNFSQQLQSGDNFTATNLPFSVQLTGLSAGTRYYYQVEAMNTVAFNQSTVQQFITTEQRM